MNILITNDDGIDAPGISVLARAAAKFGAVTVVAPAEQCSAMSHRITLSRRMRIEKRELDIPGVAAYALDGTPAACRQKNAQEFLAGKVPGVMAQYAPGLFSTLQHTHSAHPAPDEDADAVQQLVEWRENAPYG